MVITTLLLVAAQEAPGSETIPFPTPLYARLPTNFEFVEDSSVGLGRSLAVADVNGDGIGDIIAGAHELGPGSDYGAAVVFDGATLEVLAFLHNPKPRYNDDFGLAVGAADFTGDGRAEVVVGSLDDSVLFDGASLLPIRVLETVDAIGLGDCNADGELDLVLAASLGSHAGTVRFGPNLNASATLPVLPGTRGAHTTAIGDLDGDDADDVLLADLYADGDGRCWFTLGPNFATVHEINDPEPTRDGWFGRTLTIADFDADSRNDVLVTSRRTPCEYNDLCRDTLLYFGPDFTSYRQVTDRQDSWRWGLGSLATSGDVNDDGIADVVAVAGVPVAYKWGYLYLPEFFVYLGPDLHQVVRFWPPDRDDRDGRSGGGGAFVWTDHDGDGRQEFFIGNTSARSLRGHRPGWSDTMSGVVYMFDFSPADPISSFGRSSTGSGGFEPRLSASGSARAGSVLELTIDRALGGAAGLVLIGSERTSILVCPPASFLLNNSYVRVVAEQSLPITIEGTPGTPGIGTLRLRIPIPSDSVTPWQGIYYQALILDPQGPCGQAATNGVQVFVQP